jgi:glycosyltransferase involved in cell wall biosynthesis
MRIALIGPFGFGPRGTVQVRTLPLARELAARGHAVTLLMAPFHTPQEGARRREQDGVALETVAVSRLPLLGYWLTAGRLARRARVWRPDVIHGFKPKAYSGLALWLLWWRNRVGRSVPLIVDSDDWEGWGGWNELAPYSWPQKVFFAWQERWGLTHAHAVTVASRHLETIVWSLGVPPGRVVYVPNGPGAPAPTAGERGQVRAQGERDGVPVILLYTRFFEFDPGRVVRALASVRRSVPAARLQVVGTGLAGEEEAFHRAVAAAGLAGAVDDAGWVEPERLPACFAAASCAIYPFDDTLVNRTKCPVKLADLLAAGVPVVAEDVGQAGEYIEPGRSGLLVPPGDEAALAAGVVRLLQDPALRAELSAGARRRIEERFTWSRLAADLERAYQL